MTSKRVTRSTAPNRESGSLTGQVRMVSRGDRQSNQLPEMDQVSELLASNSHGNMIIDPPFSVEKLFSLVEQSSMLPQCIDAMETNTVSAGWEIAPLVRDGEIDDDEKDELQSFIDHANSEESMMTVVGKAIHDREAVGFGFIEVIRDARDDIALLRHAPSITTRLTARHPDPQKVVYDIQRGKRFTKVVEFKRFRKYVQVVGGKLTWFKEFGDPRVMNSRTGMFSTDPGYTHEQDNVATEIYHIRYQSNDAYGKPKWLSLLPGIIGARESEEVNMRFFEDNTIPPVMITVAGGRLTAASWKEMQAMVKKAGKDKMNKMVLLEAVSDSDSLDKTNSVQIKVDKLTSERPSDGLFKEYKEGNQADVRSAFRLPPVAVGMSQDANFATANVSQFVAETQVFAPARVKIDEGLNNLLVNGRNGLRLRTCKLVARTPVISSPEMVLKALTALNVIGAVTPRSAQMIANGMLQIELPPYPEKDEEGYEEWMDQPMPITVKEKSPNNDGPTQDTHDGQSQKDAATKETEKDGDISAKAPEHGQE